MTTPSLRNEFLRKRDDQIHAFPCKLTYRAKPVGFHDLLSIYAAVQVRYERGRFPRFHDPVRHRLILGWRARWGCIGEWRRRGHRRRRSLCFDGRSHGVRCLQQRLSCLHFWRWRPRRWGRWYGGGYLQRGRLCKRKLLTHLTCLGASRQQCRPGPWRRRSTEQAHHADGHQTDNHRCAKNGHSQPQRRQGSQATG